MYFPAKKWEILNGEDEAFHILSENQEVYLHRTTPTAPTDGTAFIMREELLMAESKDQAESALIRPERIGTNRGDPQDATVRQTEGFRYPQRERTSRLRFKMNSLTRPMGEDKQNDN